MSARGRPLGFAVLALLAMAAIGCARQRPKVEAAKTLPPVVLALLALGPADLDGLYTLTSEQYVDEDGALSSVPTHEFERRLAVKNPLPAGSAPPAASRLLITLGDKGTNAASEFVDATDDEDVGPANVEENVRQQLTDAYDVHAELLHDFDSVGDDTVAFRVTWRQGADQVRSYWAYIRSGGFLALVALGSVLDSGGNEPEGLRRQAETLVRKQADKLKVSTEPTPNRRR